MKSKFIVGFVVIAAVFGWLVFTAQEWGANTIGYSNFVEAKSNGKLTSVKGYWVKEKQSNITVNVFTFYMEDEDGNELEVIYEKGKPNNFEQATSIVVQGKYDQDGRFHANNILVKCPSKYQSEKADTKKT